MRIVIIDNSIGVTGAIKAIIETIDGLRKEHEFFFLIPKGSKTAHILKQHDFPYYEMDFIEISRNFWKNLAYPFRLFRNAYKLSRLIKKEKIDFVQVNDIYNLVGIFTKLFIKVKVLVHIRRMPESFPSVVYNIWVKIVSRYADAILPVSNANSRIFKNKAKLKVLYDPAILDERSFSYGENTASDTLKILYLANYTRGKGQNYAIEAMKLLQERDLKGISPLLKFVGSDFDLLTNSLFKKELQEKTKEYKLNNCIEFHGASTNVFEEISQCDIMLNFSDSESLSRVTMEALYYGVPIIATDVGGTNEMITHGFNGLLVERGNVENMTEELYELILSSEKRLLLHKNNEGFIQHKFSPETISNELNKIYYSLR